MLKITVVGAGICGLSSAFCLSEKFPSSEITIVSDKWHPHTTSDHGFGIVGLRCIDYLDDAANISSYVMETRNYCLSHDREQARKKGIQLANSLSVTHERTDDDRKNAQNFASSGLNVKLVSEADLDDCELQRDELERLFHEENDFNSNNVKFYMGQYFTIDTGKYLPWLIESLKNLKHKDGKKRIIFSTKQLSSLSEVASCDLIVNCSGLGAQTLVDDPYMVPIRGQYISLEPCSLNRLLLLNHTFLVPRFNDVAVGSVYQIGRTDRQIDPEDTEDILRRAEVGFPAIRQAKVRKVDVGIRPGRIGGPRVELEMRKIWSEKVTPVIHNYGHGPRGIAQHYGCALKVCKLASSLFKAKSFL